MGGRKPPQGVKPMDDTGNSDEDGTFIDSQRMIPRVSCLSMRIVSIYE